LTVGIPGAGIGGLFYLLSALWMPFREGWRLLCGRSTSGSRSTVKRQVGIAVAILASMSFTAWLLARLLTITIPQAAGTAASGGVQPHLARLMSYSALAVSLCTLATILAVMTVLRLIVRPRVVTSKSISTQGIAALTVALVLVLDPASVESQASKNADIRQHLQQADTAFKDEDSATAEREYRAVINADADNSHAIFRLAQLTQKSNRTEAEELYRRYVELEPSDVWGYLALADFLGRDRRYVEAIKLSREAVRQAPEERDAVLGCARLLARSGQTDRAIAMYEQWLHSHPGDAEASHELAREYQRAGQPGSALVALQRYGSDSRDKETVQRLESLSRITAPAIDPLVAWSRDSDGNTRVRTLIGSDFAAGERTRLQLNVGRTQISDAVETRSFNDFMLTTRWRPRAAFDFDAGAGAMRTSSSELIPLANVRARFRAPSDALRLDLRFNRSPMDATPALLVNRIVRNEFQARPDLALSQRFRVRGVGGAALIEGGGDRNQRFIAGAGTAWKTSDAMELSASVTQSSYDHATQAGYFAPKKLQSIDGGTYLEKEGDAFLLALDLGGGVERFQVNGQAFGRWAPVFRGYALLSFRLQPGRELRFEIDSYNTHAGPVVVPTPGWKYGSVTASLHWAIR
jgi:Tfp pilus assembly protein PilF